MMVGKPSKGDVLRELCALCGAPVPHEAEISALAPDSSFVHPHEAQYDGKRVIVACSRDHLHEVIEQYQRRPFVAAELWSGKITRAIEQYPRGDTLEDLVEETGLDPSQIQAGLTWENQELLGGHDEFRQEGGPEADD